MSSTVVVRCDKIPLLVTVVEIGPRRMTTRSQAKKFVLAPGEEKSFLVSDEYSLVVRELPEDDFLFKI